jgi:hypothetical protein
MTPDLPPSWQLQNVSVCLYYADTFDKEIRMRSNSRDTRENQIKLYDQRIQERRAELEKKGLNPKDFNKDKKYEHLKAKRRDIINALAAIDQVKARNEQPKEPVVEEAAPAPAPSKEKKPKKEKAAKAAPAKA